MNEAYEWIRAASLEMRDMVQVLFRDLHQHPELAGNEFRTASRVAEVLREHDLPVRERVGGGAGLTCVVEGRLPGRTIAIRADMDALPIQEEADVCFRSETPGIMHACGHDLHTAVLVGTACLLERLKDKLPGRFVCVWQPSEEVPPGGALPMLADHILEEPWVDRVIGFHSDPRFLAGQIALCEGPSMANADDFEIVIRGIAGHGSTPHRAKDAIVAGANIVNALQQIISRSVGPCEPVALSVGRFHGGTARNVICDHVEIAGTARTLTPEHRARVRRRIEETVRGIALVCSVEVELRYMEGYPALVSTREYMEMAWEVGERYLGDQCVKLLEEPDLGGEDFAYFLQQRPGVHLRLGTRTNPEAPVYFWHHPRFQIDERALETGTGYLAALAWEMARKVE